LHREKARKRGNTLYISSLSSALLAQNIRKAPKVHLFSGSIRKEAESSTDGKLTRPKPINNAAGAGGFRFSMYCSRPIARPDTLGKFL